MVLVITTNAVTKSLLNPLVWTELSRDRRDIDPHSPDLHCVDVSTRGEVKWYEEKCEQCTATFEKRTTSRSQQVSVIFLSLQYNCLLF